MCSKSCGKLFTLYLSACTTHPQPVLHTFAVYQIVIIVFIGMLSLDTSSMQNKMVQGCHLL